MNIYNINIMNTNCINFIRFKFGLNYKMLLVGTSNGFVYYGLDPNPHFILSPISIKNEKTGGTGIGIIDNLNDTTICVLVGGGTSPLAAPNRFAITPLSFPNQEETPKNKLTEKTTCNKKVVTVKDPIKNIFLVRALENGNPVNSTIIVTSSEISICSMGGTTTSKRDTWNNDKGICDIACSHELKIPLIIAYPTQKQGEIGIWRVEQEEVTLIQAHEGIITNIGLSVDGKQVVTTSQSATNVHVYDTITGTLLHKFRRNTNLTFGLTENTEIWSVCISENKNYVACCSENGTVHIFDTKAKQDTQNKGSSFSFAGIISSYWKSAWAMKTISLGISDKMICKFDNKGDLHIASYGGDYFKCEIQKNFDPKGTALNVSSKTQN